MINKVTQGDCLEIMHDIKDGSVDMILCDLPYGTTACSWDTVIPFEPLWAHYKRVIKENGAIVLTGSQPFTTDLINSNREWFRYELIWNKRIPTGVALVKKRQMKVHENILIFYRSQPTYNPQKRETQGNRFGKQKAHIIESAPMDTSKAQQNVGYPFSIVEIIKPYNLHKTDKAGLHPTQKPVALFECLIKTYTNEGDTVLDNCAGSGPTAIACIKNKRNYILIEQEQKYIDIINKRIDEETAQGRLF